MSEKRRPTGDFVDITFGELTIRFCGCYTPGDSGRHTLSNGDPGYPGTPAEFEWETAWLGETEVTDFVNELLELDDDRLHEKLLEQAEEDASDEPDAPDMDQGDPL